MLCAEIHIVFSRNAFVFAPSSNQILACVAGSHFPAEEHPSAKAPSQCGENRPEALFAATNFNG
jgi:hypothetical protein